jgi:Skp family chaperone for outer membrane proteins
VPLGGPAIAGVCLISQPAVFSNSKAGQAASARLKQLSDQAQAEIDAERAPIEADAKAIDADAKLKPADKAAKTDGGAIAYRYCSEKELASGLEPVLFRHGFTMLFGQRDEGERTVAIITLIHRDGHEETREYSVRSGATNRMKDATAADTGATTSAWRHLVIKMFSLKSRIREDDDARNQGGGDKVTPQQADELERRVKETNINVAAFLKLAKAATFGEIQAIQYDILDAILRTKEARGR